MTKRFCSDCETFHDGPCSVAALARAGKGGKKRKGGDSNTRHSSLPREHIAPPLTADVPAEAIRKLGNVLTSKAVTDLEKDLNLPGAEDGWKTRYEALLAQIEEQKQSNRERVQKHRAKKAER